jgi:hypothetical protein
MDAVSSLRGVIDGAVDDVEPSSFRDHIREVTDDISLTPGVLTITTARTLDPSLDPETSAQRGAGVQLSYTGLELTRSVLREQRWDGERESYYYDLLAAEILVSRGLYYLSKTGVRHEAVGIVRKFGRTQADQAALGTRHADDPLEGDVLRLAVNAGADLATQATPPAIATYRDELVADLQTYPLPGPDEALAGVEERLTTLAGDREATEADG